MALKETKRRRKSYVELQPDQRYLLQHGPLLDGMEALLKDWDYLKEVWQIHRKDICNSFHERDPSRMPWGWWVFDTPGAPNKDGISTFWKIDAKGYVIEETETQILKRLGLLGRARKLGFIEK